MDEIKKMSIVIEHWIEHNQSHMDEYRKWARRADELGLKQITVEIEEAIRALSLSNRHLEKALKAVETPLA